MKTLKNVAIFLAVASAGAVIGFTLRNRFSDAAAPETPAPAAPAAAAKPPLLKCDAKNPCNWDWMGNY